MKKLLLILLFVPLVSFGQNSSIENELKIYFDSNELDPIEGFWMCSYNGELYLKIGIKKSGNSYEEYYIKKYSKTAGKDRTGQIVAKIEPTASDNVFYFTENSSPGTGVLISDTYMEVSFKNSVVVSLVKSYPKSNSKIKNDGEWAGNGSGVIISKSGYIITNHHVIEDADDIEVEFILNDEVQKFKAEVVQIDKTNDLAILKILDMNFDGVGELPYNFKTRSSDVGTKVYAFGYPMALSIMGKEIKVTDGMISSKTGFDGNITTYQITAPIQGGNSGGPLFDEKGNLIGINSSGIRKDIADNVAYSIKTSYVLNLIDILPKSIELPSNTKLESLPLTEQIKEISKYVVLIKVK